MNLREAVAATMPLEERSFGHFRERIPEQWIEDALRATGVATMRRRRLPAEQVVWIVIAMALYRNRAISDVVSRLDLALPGGTGEAAPSGIVQARQRLGQEPMEWLFHRCAEAWAHASAAKHTWRGLRVYGVDGVELRVPDTQENRNEFGGYRDKDGADSGYPLVRAVALMALRSHLVARVAFGAHDVSEHVFAATLWDEVPENSLVVVDKGFFSAEVLMGIASLKERHWLTRARKNTVWKVKETFAENDLLVEMSVSPQAQRRNEALPETWQARAIRYQRKGFEPSWLLTSLTDPAAHPASELIELYHERWEIELGYDELKTELLDREETLRSKSPDTVRQELWGIFLAYNLVRVEMERIAAEVGVLPTRISFVGAFRLITDEWAWCAVASPGAIPKNLARLRKNVARLVLPPRRSERQYPRAVKMWINTYPKKAPNRLRRTN